MKTIGAALFGLVILVAASAAQAAGALTALESNDPFALEEALKDPRLSPAQAALLKGALAAMRFEDETAIQSLQNGVSDQRLDVRWRRRGMSLLGGVTLRAGKYAAALQAFDARIALADPSQPESDRRSLKQTRDVAYALRAEQPQTHDPVRPGAVPIRRDIAGLARAAMQVNGVDQELILDTGAGYSIVMRSVAAKLRLRPLADPVTVGSTTAHAVPAYMAVADEVVVAGNRFRNVAFLVMADELLTFANGAIKIDGAIGFPVLSRLGRIEFAQSAAGETFRIAPSVPKGGASDLYVDLLRPMLVLDVAGAGRVRMLLDTGANRSSLNGTFAAAFPAIMSAATTEKSQIGGAGGVRTIEVKALRNVGFSADGATRRLDKITVSDEKKDEHGAVGQDLLRADGGFALDFGSMDFVYLPRQ